MTLSVLLKFFFICCKSLFGKQPGQGTGPTGLRDFGHFL